MKRWRHLGWGICAVLILAFAASIWWSIVEIKDRLDEETIDRWSATIPLLESRDLTFTEAVAVLNRGIEAEPGHPKGLRIVIASDAESKKAIRRPIHSPLETPSPVAPTENESSFKYSLLNLWLAPSYLPPIADLDQPIGTPTAAGVGPVRTIPLRESIRYICGNNRQFRIKGRTIILYRCEPNCTVSPLITKEFRMVPGLLPSTTPGQWVDCSSFFTSNGLTFYEGGYAQWHSDKGLLRMRTTEEMFSHIDDLSATPSRWERCRDWIIDNLLPPYQ